MDIRKIKKLIELLEESSLSEIEIVEGEESVRLSRSAVAPAAAMHYAPPVAAPAPPPAAAPSPAPRSTVLVADVVVAVFLVGREPVMEEHARDAPVSRHGGHGDLKHFRHFFLRHAAEIAQHDDLFLAGVDGFQPRQGVLESENVHIVRTGGDGAFDQGDPQNNLESLESQNSRSPPAGLRR